MALPAAFAASSPYVANPSLYGVGFGPSSSGFNPTLPPFQRSRPRIPNTPVPRTVAKDVGSQSTLPEGTTQNALPIPGSISAATAQTPETNVTSQFLETPSSLVPSEATMASPEMNGLFGAKAPSYTGLPTGQETPLPGSIFNPLAQIGGGVVESTPVTSDPLASATALGTQNAAQNEIGAPGSSSLLSGVENLIPSLLGVGHGLIPGLGGKGANSLGGLSTGLGGLLTGAGAGGLLGLTTPGLGGLIQPGPIGALEGAGVGALSSGLATGLGGLGMGLAANAGLDTLAGILGTAVPFLAPFAALVPFLFQGANPYQTLPAKAQQPFEVAADDVYNAVKGGYVTPAQGVQAIQSLEQNAQGSLQNVLSQIPAGHMNQKIANTPGEVQNILSNEAQQIENLGNVAPASGAPDWTSLFLNPSTKGWYTPSIPSGNEMAAQLLNSLVPGLGAVA